MEGFERNNGNNINSADCHERLGIAPGATSEEILTAFRKLAMRYHPDQGGSTDHFKLLVEAKDHLLDGINKNVDSGATLDSVEQTRSFDELYAVLEQIGGLEGSSGRHYSPSALRSIIERVRSGELSLGHITRTQGLRNHVEQLLET